LIDLAKQQHKTQDYDPDRYLQTFAALWDSEGALLKTLAEAGFQTRLYACNPGVYHFDHRWISNAQLKGKDVYKGIRWDHLLRTGIGPVVDSAIVRSLPIVFKPADASQFHPVQIALQRITKASFRDSAIINDKQLLRVIAENPISAKAEKPILNVIHFRAVHAPFRLNENLEYEVMHGDAGEDRQTFATLRLLKRLIDDMKSIGVYDNTLIVIASDHGSLQASRDEQEFHNPLLLIKRQNERHDAMVHREKAASVQDVTPTILNLLGLENPPGRASLFLPGQEQLQNVPKQGHHRSE
jgi:hypothetical protein